MIDFIISNWWIILLITSFLLIVLNTLEATRQVIKNY